MDASWNFVACSVSKGTSLSTPVIKVGHLLSELGFDLETSDTLLIII